MLPGIYVSTVVLDFAKGGKNGDRGRMETGWDGDGGRMEMGSGMIHEDERGDAPERTITNPSTLLRIFAMSASPDIYY